MNDLFGYIHCFVNIIRVIINAISLDITVGQIPMIENAMLKVICI